MGFCVCISRVACLGAEPLTQLTFQPVHPHLVLGYLQTVPSRCGCSLWTRSSGHCSDAAKLWVLTSSKGLSAHDLVPGDTVVTCFEAMRHPSPFLLFSSALRCEQSSSA